MQILDDVKNLAEPNLFLAGRDMAVAQCVFPSYVGHRLVWPHVSNVRSPAPVGRGSRDPARHPVLSAMARETSSCVIT